MLAPPRIMKIKKIPSTLELLKAAILSEYVEKPAHDMEVKVWVIAS
jgi:hypothetical protein